MIVRNKKMGAKCSSDSSVLFRYDNNVFFFFIFRFMFARQQLCAAWGCSSYVFGLIQLL